MEVKARPQASIVSGDNIPEGHIKHFGLATNESMSDISSVSEFESELGYASCENEDDSLDSCVSDGGQQRLNVTRRKLQSKHRLDQLRRCEIYSNDSDTTVDDNVTNARRVRRAAPKQEAEAVRMNAFSVKPKQKTTNEFRRTRNGSKGSWTDSGVSMSKTDSQPNTLGDRTKTKMMSQKFLSTNESAERSGNKAGAFHNVLEEMSPVELLRGEIRRRSRSSSELSKQGNDQRRDRQRGVLRQQMPNDAENAEWNSLAGGLTDSKRIESQVKKDGRPRYPEIIKLEDKEKSSKVKKVPSKKHVAKENAPESLEVKMKLKEVEDFTQLSEKENEIIRTLLENATEAESKRKNSVQSHWSHSTSDSTTYDSEKPKPRRSKLQRLKEIFLRRSEKSQTGRMAESSPLKNDLIDIGQCSSPSFDSYFSDDTSTCVDHLCCCEYDDCGSKGFDHLSHLGRAVYTKKRNILSRLFRSVSKSSDNIQYQNGRVHRSRSHLASEVPIGRKRSSSTRSLPDSLKYLYLKALSKSVDNVGNDILPSVLQQTGVFTPHPGFYVKRSRSSSSLFKYQLGSNIPIDMSKSSEAIPYCFQNARSPPVRRSESLRSLNKNYDIATHVLHSKAPADDVRENNNLLYHPYFQGHTARDDCNLGTSQDQDGTSCTCHLTRNQGSVASAGYISSPLSSPRSGYKGHYCGASRDDTYWATNSGIPNEPSMLLSPQRRGTRGAVCYYQGNLFENNYFFGGDICAQGECESKQALMQGEMAEQSPRRRNERRDSDCLVVAPLEVRVTKERHAERVKLKTARNFDTSV